MESLPQVTIKNHVNITDFFVKDNRIQGAFGFGIQDDNVYVIEANAVIIATGRRCRTVQAQSSRLFPAQDVVSAV